ncbi:YihY/virulence factor BrkB family protein [Altererythrobacter sp.]|nr:YihY/virulence factor BrkB family protein [Altererythrobacter sp.]
MGAIKTGGLPEASDRTVLSPSPEERRRAALAPRKTLAQRVGPGTRIFEVIKRVAVGTYNDGFIHAGNLAYLAIIAIFPFFITGAAIFALVGEDGERAATINTVLLALPPTVAETIGPVAREVIEARSGWLLWVGGIIGLWTVGSLVETIRDILRRAYGTEAVRAFWQYRLLSMGMIVGSVVLLMLSLTAQFAISTAQQFISAYVPRLEGILAQLALSRIIPALGLFGSIYLLFYSLTPTAYRKRRYPKWPGALLVTLWWVTVTVTMPIVLRSFVSYDLTYGSLAGIMVALFFFWLVGLGMVVGAELNAALAETPEEEKLGATGETD